MDAEKILLLRKTFAEVERHRGVAALLFYRRLFALDPSLRSMFHSNIEAQGEKLMDMLGFALSVLDRPESLEPELEQLGARHLDYGTKLHHYEIVGQALLDMFAEVLQERFSPEMRAAWTEFYEYMADVMCRGAAALSPSPHPLNRHPQTGADSP